MSAHHPAVLSRGGVPSHAELRAWLMAQDNLDIAAHRCRQTCEVAGLHPALTAALVARTASPDVLRAAAERFRWWQRSLGDLERTLIFYGLTVACPSHPDERQAAGEIVATCIEAERAGLLERPIR